MHPSSSQSDRQHTILVKIKTDLGRAKVFTNWNTKNPVCNFIGIVCSGENSVKEIDLSHQKLAGALDFDSICSSSLGSSLEKLSLGSNLLHVPVYFYLSFSSSPCIPSSSQSDPQHTILLKIKTDLGRAKVFTNWNTKNPVCNFIGIVCSGENSVKEINLSHQKLSGALDFDLICSSSLGSSLKKLSLRSNLLHGTISSHVSNCTNLNYLDLSDNHFSGEFPEISSLTKYHFLKLNLSGFSGQFPWKSLQYLTNLTNLSLGDNPFELTPFPLEILNLEKLQNLFFSNSSIQGTIPEAIGNLLSLQTLELSDNYLVGEIPDTITKLNNLQEVEMDWNVRYMIAMGAAQGLEYLHHKCAQLVIHRDVKSSYILLDEEMKPKIVDFGLAKIVQANNVMDSTEIIAGTYGYIAPVILMELVTGKKPIQSEFGENKDIVCWIHDEIRSDEMSDEMRSKDTLITLVDPTIAYDCKEDAVKMLMIALHCTKKTPGLRPSMEKVVKMLERIQPCPPVDIVNAPANVPLRRCYTPTFPHRSLPSFQVNALANSSSPALLHIGVSSPSSSFIPHPWTKAAKLSNLAGHPYDVNDLYRDMNFLKPYHPDWLSSVIWMKMIDHWNEQWKTLSLASCKNRMTEVDGEISLVDRFRSESTMLAW
ncbi:hypothetical protein OSB04_002194 [Centaurea solstitialis]|uniref:non-specific serine/threonine protein kinase n=1 Tax=Centaurea solstitialis TaxID=347529 RepID=A0AA38UB08_9ASTR|nr:hypothetical protein OSB04_002194 [Centaurea solstitialis]